LVVALLLIIARNRTASRGLGGLQWRPGMAVTTALVDSGTGAAPKEAAMEEHFVWMTTRRIRPGTLQEFMRAWRPDPSPEGLHNAYAYWSEDEQEVIGVSFWDSKESCDAWRASQAEARRREAMAPCVIEEGEAFYRGRELALSAR
jgi:heme-degrading monooxygenase HmoA